EKRLDHALFLGVDQVRAVQVEIASERFRRRRRHEYAVQPARRLEAGGYVDPVAPHVIGEFSRANDARHKRPGMQTYTARERDRQRLVWAAGASDHVGRELPGARGGAGAGRGDAGDRHIVVSRRLDLFDSGILSQPIELAEQVIEAPDDLIGFHTSRDPAEP